MGVGGQRGKGRTGAFALPHQPPRSHDAVAHLVGRRGALLRRLRAGRRGGGAADLVVRLVTPQGLQVLEGLVARNLRLPPGPEGDLLVHVASRDDLLHEVGRHVPARLALGLQWTGHIAQRRGA